jgi:hypothetical protein
MILPSQQFCLCGTIFNVHDTLMKHASKLALRIIAQTTTKKLRKNKEKISTQLSLSLIKMYLLNKSNLLVN